MAKPDLSKLSLDELQAVIAEAQAIATGKREEQLDSRIAVLFNELHDAGFTDAEINQAVKRATGTKVPPSTTPKKVKSPGVKKPMPTPGATYKNPATGETWTAKVPLKRTVGWLRDLVDGGKNFDEFVVR